jgi:predicted ArsR family transcriptional regulator
MPTDAFDPPTAPARPTASRLLTLLKTRGAQTAADLGMALGITGEAARQHLVKLAADGLVSASSEPRGVGRPVQLWSLTETGHARFPDTHAELTAQLIGVIRSELGEEALERVIAARAAQTAPAYESALEGAADLGERVAWLAEARTREGYMAECLPQGEEEFLLVENHCPICTAATACQGFCRAELDVFRRVLGRGVSVEREEHIVGGDRRCAYRVALKTVPPANPPTDKKGRSS